MSPRLLKLGVTTIVVLIAALEWWMVGGENPLRHSSTSAESPISLSTRYLDLGRGAPRDVLEGVIAVTNTSSRPLSFSATGSCGCSKLSPGAGVLAPGESENLHVLVALPAVRGPQKTVNVVVRVENGEDGAYEAACVCVASCPPLLTATPSAVTLVQNSDSRDETTTPVAVTVRRHPEAESNLDLSSVTVRSRSGLVGIEMVARNAEEVQFRVAPVASSVIGATRHVRCHACEAETSHEDGVSESSDVLRVGCAFANT